MWRTFKGFLGGEEFAEGFWMWTAIFAGIAVIGTGVQEDAAFLLGVFVPAIAVAALFVLVAPLWIISQLIERLWVIPRARRH